MEKIIGLGNALVDVLAVLKDDSLLEKMSLMKGCMQLIGDAEKRQIDACFSQMHTHLATGGAAANTILALACLGVPVAFAGKVGNDAYGNFFRENLKRNHIIDKVEVSKDLPSGVASTFISPGGERTFGTYLGAASALEAGDLRKEMFEGYDCLFIEGYLVQNHAMVLRALELAREAGLTVAIDMATSNIVAADRDFFATLLRGYVDIVFANEEEAKAYTGKMQPQEALAVLAQDCSVAVVKVGAKGAYARRGGEVVRVDACPVAKVVDTTGAGDYFAAGFLYGLVQGCSLLKCAKMGSLLAGAVIQVVGTTVSKPVWDEITLNIGKVLAE